MRMHAAKLTSQQRQQVVNRLQPTTGYLIRLAERMQKLGWHPEDPVYVAAWKAHEQLTALLMALNFAGCLHAWEPPEERRPALGPPKSAGEGKNGKLRNTFR